MVENILMLLKTKLMFIEELADFSDELKEEINFYFRGSLLN
ncbi:MAG: hypothetical protein ACI35S_02735 [Anaeroplasma sp.]